MILHELGREWSRLTETNSALPWAASCPALAAALSLDDVLDCTKTPAADEVLRYLVGEHQAGDPVAGRVVLQAMIPKIVTMARGWLRTQVDPMADLVAQMWIQIDQYPLEARPRKIAANLALDSLKHVRKLWAADSEPDDKASPAPGDWLEAVEPEDPVVDDITAAAILHEALDRGLISERVYSILTAVYDEGLSGREAAARFGVSVDSIRFHCSQSIRRRLVPHRLELAA